MKGVYRLSEVRTLTSVVMPSSVVLSIDTVVVI